MSDHEWKIEMLWDCPAGHKRQLGRNLQCSECGYARVEKDEYYMPDDPEHAPEVTDAKQLEDACAGPNWTCEFCGKHERRNGNECANCGAKPKEDVLSDAPALVYDTATFPDISTKQEPENTPENTPVPQQISVPPEDDVINDFSATRRRFTAFKIGSIITGVLLGISFIIWLFIPSKVDTTVQSVAWTHTIHIERKQIVEQTGFEEDEPGDAFNIQPDGTKYHHSNHVRIGSHIEHYNVSVQCGQTCVDIPRRCSTSCTPGKNGYASCRESCSGGGKSCSPKYCDQDRTRTVDDYEDVPVYRPYFSWAVWRWVHNRDVVHSGATLETNWPSADEEHLDAGVSPGEEERESGRDESYTVVFGDGKETWTSHPSGENNFKRYSLGSKWTITKDHLGIIHDIQPTGN